MLTRVLAAARHGVRWDRAAAVERVQRRVERLQRVDAGRQRRLDAAPAERGPSRRAVISTSGSSGMPVLRLAGTGGRVAA